MLGYPAAVFEIQEQLTELGIEKPTPEAPLVVYIPCGVGGGPAGVAWGLKSVFGDNVHIVFAEPVESPCVTLGLMTGKHEEICVRDIGLTNFTEADGLAVARPSGLACRMMEHLLYGSYTVSDEALFDNLRTLDKTCGLYIE